MKLSKCTECGAELRLIPTLCPLCGAEIKREAASFDGWQVDHYQAEVRRLRGELGRDDPKRRGAALVIATEEG
ncbi:MAG: hypothetical protein H0W55_06250 [Actinobacteria bacterium]|nr:hypothetical protein [Actinomycetota bacterium]MDQ3531397.1 hypothetical protein [Actinomycetota bacterium]